ncbi:acyltransferase family protein [Actinomadura sp. 9N407]|uniref:acyltransferase family protein n=1 Tax=Actinomadura sp. 9N407 TaxID=3375154 RepID=UPI0037A255F8
MTQTSEPPVASEIVEERSPQRSPEQPKGAVPRRRDPHLDNAKFLALMLVVAGHGVAGLREVPLGAAIYNYFYMFHMPVFVVVSGYLSKRFTFTDDKVVGLVGSTLAPYALFQTAYALFAWQLGGRSFQIDLLDPFFLCWFLVALFVWRLLTPIWRRLRYPVAAAVLVSLLVFMSDIGNTLDLHRIIGLLPFYVLGLTLRPEMLEIVRRPAARILGAVILLGGFVLAYFTYDHMNVAWLRWDTANGELGVDELTGTLMRMALLVLALVLSAAFLAVVPSRRTWYTALGAATLYAYLLHGFPARLFTYMGWDGLDVLQSVPGVLVTVVAFFGIGILLSTRPVCRVTRWAVEPNIRPLFTKR